MLTGRDAAHKKMTDMLAAGEQLPVDLSGRFIYYVGPVDPVRDEVMGPQDQQQRREWISLPTLCLSKLGLWE